MHCIFFPWDENEFSEMHLRLTVICTIPSSKALLIGNASHCYLSAIGISMSNEPFISSEARAAVVSEGKRRLIITAIVRQF